MARVLWSVAGFAFDFDTCTLGQLFDGFRKIKMIVIHDKAKSVTACATAKTVIELFFMVDAERGGFLLVKRAASSVVLSGLF